MFFGTYTPKLDDKGRLTLPAKFRDALAGGLMVTKSQDHSLAVYPRAGAPEPGASTNASLDDTWRGMGRWSFRAPTLRFARVDGGVPGLLRRD